MYSKPAALLAAYLSTVAVLPAKASNISAAQADALQARMQSWLQGTVNPDAHLASPALQVRPEGDHYRIELPLGAPRGGQPNPVSLFASAWPLENGRWSFEGPYLPSPASFTLNMPVPAKNGKAPDSTIPVEYTITSGSGRSQGTYDPSFATPSVMTSNSQGMQIRAQSALTDQLTKIERSSSTYTLRPSGSGRVDLAVNGTSEGLAVVTLSQDAPLMEFSAQQTRTTGGITALSRDRAAVMVPAVVRLATGVLAGPPGPDGQAPAAHPLLDPQLLRTILQSLQDLASEFTVDETFEGVTLRFGTHGGAASQFRVGVGAKTDGGLLQASMDLNLDGLVLPDAAPGAMAELVPRHVALHPVLTGVPTEELIRWLSATADAKDGARPPGFATLLRRAGVSAGLDSFALEIGSTSFAGAGKLTTLSPDALSGQAQITASNFDDLIARVNAIPDLAGVLPLFVFAKGVSQTVEGRLVWNLAYRDNKLLVNGTDLSAMTGRAPVQGPKSR